MVLLGGAVRSYPQLSKLSFNKLLIQKDLSLAFSYSGFILGITVIMIASFSMNILSWQEYTVQVSLNIIKACLVFPIFRFAIRYVFRIKDPTLNMKEVNTQLLNMGYGIYEGVNFFTACFLTSVIIKRLEFGSFYPVIGN